MCERHLHGLHASLHVLTSRSHCSLFTAKSKRDNVTALPNIFQSLASFTASTVSTTIGSAYQRILFAVASSVAPIVKRAFYLVDFIVLPPFHATVVPRRACWVGAYQHPHSSIYARVCPFCCRFLNVLCLWCR